MSGRKRPSMQGTRNHRNRWTEDDVRGMRSMAAAGASNRQIAEYYKTSRRSVWAIVTRQAWAWLD